MIELIIGREAGVEKPRLVIYQNDQPAFFGNPGSVPKGVSRKHVRVTIDEDLKMLIEDITDNNFMYINGTDCKRKNGVSVNDTVELGPTRYKLDLEAILKALSGKQVYSIGHLEEVYENYQKEKMDMQVKQGKFNAISSIPMILSMGSGLLCAFFPDIKTILFIIAVSLLLVFFIIRYRNASAIPIKNREMDNHFREKYICPNPMCKHFLGTTSYKELLKNKSCPYCKSKFKE